MEDDAERDGGHTGTLVVPQPHLPAVTTPPPQHILHDNEHMPVFISESNLKF